MHSDEDIAREAAEKLNTWIMNQSMGAPSSTMLAVMYAAARGVEAEATRIYGEAIRQAVEQERAQHEQVLASVRRFLALSSQFDRWIIEADRNWLRAFHEAEKAVGQ